MNTASYTDWLAHYELPDCQEAVEDYEHYVEGVAFTRSLFDGDLGEQMAHFETGGEA